VERGSKTGRLSVSWWLLRQCRPLKLDGEGELSEA
jgi:hypothetical protein